MEITLEDFLKVDIRVGKVVDAREFPEAHIPAYQIWVDFGGDIGVKKTSARITENYNPAELKGRQVMAVVNFPPKQIGKFMSEILILGLPDENGHVVLVGPDKDTPVGGRLH